MSYSEESALLVFSRIAGPEKMKDGWNTMGARIKTIPIY